MLYVDESESMVEPGVVDVIREHLIFVMRLVAQLQVLILATPDHMWEGL